MTGAFSRVDSSNRAVWPPILIVLALTAVYSNSFRGPFILDDTYAISQNPFIQRLWPLSDALKAPAQTTASGRPLVCLSLAVNYAISGLEVWSYHALNLAVHIASALLFLGIVRRTLLTPWLRSKYGPFATWLALAIALIWAVHPLQTMCVTYVIQRAESLMGLFYLLTLYCVIRGSSARPGLWYAAAVAACAAGMGCKEVMVTAPIVVLLYDWVFLSRSSKELYQRRRVLYLGLAATWLILIALVFPSPRSESAGFAFEDISPIEYLRTQPGVVLYYLRLAFWPRWLCLDYEWPIAKTASEILPAAAIMAVFSLISIGGVILRKAWGFLLAAFLLILAPSSTFIPIIIVASEHRMYLPLAAICGLAVVGVWKLLSSAGLMRDRTARWVAIVLLIITVVALGGRTYARNLDYRSGLSIWNDVLAQRPENYRAHHNLAVVLIRDGENEAAVKHYRESVRIRPEYYKARFFLALELARQGRASEALEQFDAAIRLHPEVPDAFYQSARVLIALGRVDDALGRLNEAIRLNPGFVDAHIEAANLLAGREKTGEAIGHFEKVIRLRPDFAPTYNSVGTLYLAQGNPDRAISSFRKALEIQPNLIQAKMNLAGALMQQGKTEEGLSAYRAVLEVEPTNVGARFYLAMALLRLNRLDEARVEYEALIRLTPHYAEAHLGMGMTLEKLGRKDLALKSYSEALRLKPELIPARKALERLGASNAQG